MEFFNRNKKKLEFILALDPFLEKALYDFLIFNMHCMKKVSNKHIPFGNLLRQAIISFSSKNSRIKICDLNYKLTLFKGILSIFIFTPIFHYRLLMLLKLYRRIVLIVKTILSFFFIFRRTFWIILYFI